MLYYDFTMLEFRSFGLRNFGKLPLNQHIFLSQTHYLKKFLFY